MRQITFQYKTAIKLCLCNSAYKLRIVAIAAWKIFNQFHCFENLLNLGLLFSYRRTRLFRGRKNKGFGFKHTIFSKKYISGILFVVSFIGKQFKRNLWNWMVTPTSANLTDSTCTLHFPWILYFAQPDSRLSRVDSIWKFICKNFLILNCLKLFPCFKGIKGIRQKIQT